MRSSGVQEELPFAADAAAERPAPHHSPADELNPAQREAVEHADGPLIVLAGPGTGKTRVIVHRVERIIKDGADPASVVAITFTNKAAAELRERLARSIGASGADRMYAGTIHGFGDSLIRRFGDLIDLPARHVLLDSSRHVRLLRDLVREHNLYADLLASGREAILADAAWTIERLQNWCVFPAEAERFARDWQGRLQVGGRGHDADGYAAERARAARFAGHAGLYAHFDRACREHGWYTYGDMVMLAVRLLRESPHAAALARDRCRHVIVDEFQDVDRGQIELLNLLCPARGAPDLCVVGDDDQSIYGFRGADDRAFSRFARIWHGVRTIPLEWNYRSAGPIVETANAIMARADLRFAPDKVVTPPPERRGALPARDAGVEVVEYPELDEEADAIAAMILADVRSSGRAWSSYAVIGRAHADLERVAGALAVEGVPGRVARGASLLDDRGVQDLLRWVELLSDPGSVYAAQWLLSRPPFDVPLQTGAELGRRHRAESSRHAAGEHRDPVPVFVEWLRAHEAHDSRVGRFLHVHDELHQAAATLRAHDALLRVIRGAQIAQADLLPARERALRIGRLAEVLRFVREREAILDPPRDLGAFWAYYRDLNDEERAFRADETDRFAEAQPQAEKRDEVSLLTAHKAKGLEFDTVFVIRAWPRDGFPKTRTPDEEDLPEGLVDRAGDTRGPQARAHAEERRLFYVACTRAMRRLVILTKAQKSRSESLHFVHELTRDLGAPAGVVIRSTAEVHGAAREAGVVLSGHGRLGSGSAAPTDRRSTIAHERMSLRRSAAEALDSVDRPGVGAGELRDAADRLRGAAAGLAMTAHVDEHDRPPAWAGAEGVDAAAERLLSRLHQSGVAPPGTGVFPPQPPPLRLSFSRITEYERCPRCYYLKHVLQVKETGEDSLVLGSVAHHALQRFYELVQRADAEGEPPPGLDTLCDTGRREYFRALPPGTEARRDVLDQLCAQLTRTFERLHNPRDQIEQIEFTIMFPYEHLGVEHRFEAKLDRLDLHTDASGPAGHRLIDYKTGRAAGSKLEPRSDDLQLGIYALALRHHQGIELSDRTTPARGVAEYWLLSTGERGTINLADIRYDRIRERIGKAIEGMLAGRFERAGDCRGLCEILGPSC